MTKLWLVRWYPPDPLDDEALIGQNSATILLGLNISTLKNILAFKPSRDANTLYADTVTFVTKSCSRILFSVRLLWWKKENLYTNMMKHFSICYKNLLSSSVPLMQLFQGDTHSDKYLTGFQHFPDLNWYLWWVKIYTDGEVFSLAQHLNIFWHFTTFSKG